MAAPANGTAADTAGAPHLTSAPGAEVVVNSVGKTFRRGGRRTVALSGASLRVRPGELACLLGPVRLRQVDPAADHRGRAGRRRGHRHGRGTAGHRPVPRPGHAVPDADAVRLAHHQEQHPVRPAGRSGPPGCTSATTPNSTRRPPRCWNGSAWAGSATRSRTSCRAACGTGRRSPARWPPGRRCC